MVLLCIDARGLSSFRIGSMHSSLTTHKFQHRSSARQVLRILSAAVLLMLATVETATAAESNRVILLHSFGREFKPWGEYATTIRDELNRQSPWPLDITEHSVVTARSSDEE